MAIPERADPAVHHPSHYNQLPIECWDVIQYFDFLRGSAIKYIWRASEKNNPLDEMRDIDKAMECLQKYKDRALANLNDT